MMGLDVSHDCWSGPYSTFTRFRAKLAEAGGYDVIWPPALARDMDHRLKYPLILLDWGHVTEEQLNGEWGATPRDPLLVLLVHRDTDGIIQPQQCHPLAHRISEVMPNLPDEELSGRMGTYKRAAARWVGGLLTAGVRWETVTFN